jgi:hypothetical protein
LVGSVAAVVYGWGLLEFLNAFWPGEIDRSFLRLHVLPWSFVVGYLASVVVGLAAIAWAVRILGRSAPAALLAGQPVGAQQEPGSVRRPRWGWRITGISGAAGCCLIAAGGLIHDHEAQAGTFFSGGALLLTAGLASIWAFLRRAETATALRASSVTSLGLRNAARHPTRSLLTAGLLASSAFLIVAVESFRREPGHDFLASNGGSGGFALVAESDVPIYQDLNQGAGRQEITDALERNFRQASDHPGPSPEEQMQAAQALLDSVRIMPVRLRAGDDASCLNLYQPGRPRLLGVPRSLIQRGGFEFADIIKKVNGNPLTADEQANPWLLLLRTEADGAVPVFGEANSVRWMLKKELGDVFELPGERGEPIKLRIVGLLKDSVFQSELLMSEQNFLKLYPGQEGYSFFLIETPDRQVNEAATLLKTALTDHGFDVTTSAKRLAGYLAVENTYLSTFQALGGLGLLLGSLGLAVVLLRSVWERRGELALLRALGFRRRMLGWLVLAENAFLLVLGLLVGTLTAFVSVAPHLAAGQGHVPWPRLIGLLGLVLAAGLAAGALAMRATLRAPLLPALRKE